MSDEPPALLAALNAAVTEVAKLAVRRPVQVSLRPSFRGLVSGRLDEVSVTARDVLTSGLLVDSVRVTARDVALVPGLRPRLRARSVSVTGRLLEDSVNRWLPTGSTPATLRLRPDGVGVVTEIAGVRVSEITAELTTDGRWLRLTPRRASLLGIPAPLVELVSGALPLPPLPSGASLTEVTHGDGWIEATFDLGGVDEVVDPGLGRRLRRRFQLG